MLPGGAIGYGEAVSELAGGGSSGGTQLFPSPVVVVQCRGFVGIEPLAADRNISADGTIFYIKLDSSVRDYEEGFNFDKGGANLTLNADPVPARYRIIRNSKVSGEGSGVGDNKWTGGDFFIIK